MASINGLESRNMKKQFSIENVKAFVRNKKKKYNGYDLFVGMFALWWVELILYLMSTHSSSSLLIIIVGTIINLPNTIITVLYLKNKTLFWQNLNSGVQNLSTALIVLICIYVIMYERLKIHYILLISCIIVFILIIIADYFVILVQMNKEVYLKKKKIFNQEASFGVVGGLSVLVTKVLLPQFNGDSQWYLLMAVFSVASSFCIAFSTSSFIRVYLQKKYQVDEDIEVKKDN